MVNIELVLALFVLCIVYWYSAKWLRYTSLSVLGFAYAYWLSMSVPSEGLSTPIVVQNQSPLLGEKTAVSDASIVETPDQQLQAFYQQSRGSIPKNAREQSIILQAFYQYSRGSIPKTAGQ